MEYYQMHQSPRLRHLSKEFILYDKTSSIFIFYGKRKRLKRKMKGSLSKFNERKCKLCWAFISILLNFYFDITIVVACVVNL